MSNPYTEAHDTPKVDVPHLDIDHPSIAGMTQEEAFKSCFPVGSVFADKATLVKAIKYLSAKYHTVTSIGNTTKIICACSGAMQHHRQPELLNPGQNNFVAPQTVSQCSPTLFEDDRVGGCTPRWLVSKSPGPQRYHAMETKDVIAIHGRAVPAAGS